MEIREKKRRGKKYNDEQIHGTKCQFQLRDIRIRVCLFFCDLVEIRISVIITIGTL